MRAQTARDNENTAQPPKNEKKKTETHKTASSLDCQTPQGHMATIVVSTWLQQQIRVCLSLVSLRLRVGSWLVQQEIFETNYNSIRSSQLKRDGTSRESEFGTYSHAR